MARTKCRPTRTKGKPGVKSVRVRPHRRSKPKGLGKCR